MNFPNESTTPVPPSPVYRFPDFLDLPTCSQVRAAMDRGTPEEAEVLRQGATYDGGARKASMVDVDATVLDLVEARLDAVRTVIGAHFGLLLDRREGAGFLRYHAGGFYGVHRDVADDPGWPDASRRRIAVVIFLNSSRPQPSADEFSGGELVIYAEGSTDSGQIQVVPRSGLLVAFAADMLHEVQPVRMGTRDVIVDWYY